MKIVAELFAWNTPAYIYRPKAYGPSKPIQVKALAYYLNTPKEYLDMPKHWDNVRRDKGTVGILTVVTGNNTVAKSIGIEVRPHEMAEFCRKYLAEYDAMKESQGWDTLPTLSLY